jgi:hypothetical protein
MDDRFADTRPLWMQAAEEYALERALDEAITAELAELELEEPTDVIAPPAPRASYSRQPRSCSASPSPLRLKRVDGAAPARSRADVSAAARSP